MNTNKQAIGKIGENLALKYIREAGLKLVQCNYRCALGEMDIIAAEGEVLVFIEVRTRLSGRMGWGEESITPQKKARLYRVAAQYLKYKGYDPWPPMRFDLIAIRLCPEELAESDIQWIRGI